MVAPETLPDLIEAGDGTLPVEAAEIVRAYQRASKAGATVRAYTADAEVFQAWCARFGFRSLPASPAAVAGFLVAEAEAGRAASTIGRRVAAISYAHRLAKAVDPTQDEDVRATMKGIRRKVGTAPKRKAAATADVLAALLMRTPDTLTGKRDRALLALGFAGAFRRSELVALDVSDLAEHPDGLRVTVRRSKTDQDAATGVGAAACNKRAPVSEGGGSLDLVHRAVGYDAGRDGAAAAGLNALEATAKVGVVHGRSPSV